MSLIKCKIGNSFNECIHNKLPSLVEIDIDSCYDLITFPAMLCNLIRLRKLSIIDCLNLSSLSEGFGKWKPDVFGSFSACIMLKSYRFAWIDKKPEEIKGHWSLSNCLNLNKLPEHIGEMGALQTIHMRSCTGLLNLPPSVKDLRQLEVFCDKKTSFLWNISQTWKYNC